MEFSEYDALKLDNQVCFPLYAAAREVTKLYRPYLDALNLTYTQYITMMVLWENRSCSAKKLGEKLYLDSGTLTPVIKSLEQKGFVKRSRSAVDERVLMVEVTDKGFALREEAKSVPHKMAACTNLTPEEAQTLYKLLYKVLGNQP
ncbi:MAG: MarR family transcriptional regulator [Ruminococcus sp.]|nr:MarR family transcriptional regulator [uncultured Ruminococcus sp.]MBQ1594208.1 MarR family transcriptional regulator [Ruminococcus sp.]MBQ4213862.1 MarR family transcriptional regulator [Ruminococcus sp.]